jgi:HAD superfamily hydrolase (TIGR01490 family)
MLTPPTIAAVFDLDRTVTRAGTWTPFLLHCAPLLSPRRLWRFLKGMPTLAGYIVGKVPRAALKERMVQLWIAGAPREQVEAWSYDFAERWLRSRIRPGALAAIERHRQAGHHLVLATASFDFYARVFAQRLGFHHVIATGSVWDERGRLCAQVAGENCYGEAKLQAVKAYFEALPVSPRTVAYSDHYSDLALLRWAHEGVAVNPHPKLRKVASENSLTVVDWEIAA